jgi:hypothetical protein
VTILLLPFHFLASVPSIASNTPPRQIRHIPYLDIGSGFAFSPREFTFLLLSAYKAQLDGVLVVLIAATHSVGCVQAREVAEATAL